MQFRARLELLVEQALISFSMFWINFWAFRHLNLSDLTKYVLIWTFSSSAMSTISELWITPSRILIRNFELNSALDDKSVHSSESLSAVNRFLIILITALTPMYFLLLKIETLKLLILTLLVSFSISCLVVMRHQYRFLNNSKIFMFELLCLSIMLVLSLYLLEFFNFTSLDNVLLTFSAIILLIPAKHFFASGKLRMASLIIHIRHLSRNNWLFGLSTLLRTLLYSSLLYSFLNVFQDDLAVIKVGIVLLLSSPALQIVSFLSTSLQHRIFTDNNKSNIKSHIIGEAKIHVSVMMLVVLVLSLFWNFFLIVLTPERANLVDGFGDLKVLTSVYLFLASILLSNWTALFSQFFNLKKETLIATISAGLIALGSTKWIDPLYAASLPYCLFSVIMFILLLKRKIIHFS